MNESDIFMAALEKGSLEQRNAFLDEACAGNANLRRRMESLFESHGRAGALLEHPALDAAATVHPTQDEIPTDGAAGGRGRSATSPDQISLDFLAPADDPHALGCIGPYTVTEIIGSGGMGIVLKARDPKLNRIVAIKVLAPELAANPTARKRFLREAQAAAAVVHQHVVTIHAVDDDRLPYLVMECINGQSLQEKIDRAGHLELKEILRIGQQVAAGLAAAHTQGLMHRDVKPANILLENGVERVRITDFGLARAVDDLSMTKPGEVAGTPQYMSPEQVLGQPVDARSDLFSLGSVLYAMCTGHSPFRAESMIATLRRVCDDTPRPIRERNAEIPEWLVAIIDRLLAKSPAERFQTAAEVADPLAQHLAQLQQPSFAVKELKGPPAARENRKSKSKQLWAIAMAAVAILVVGLLLTEATGVTQFARSAMRIVAGGGSLATPLDNPVPPSDKPATPPDRPATPVEKLAPLDAARHYLQVAQRKKDLPAYVALRDSLFVVGGGSSKVEVEALYREAISVFPKDGILRFHLGRVHARFGEWDKAITEFERGLELAPLDHPAWFHSGPIYLAAGDPQGFRAHCRQMLEQFGQTKDEEIAERTAMTCLLAPDAIDLKSVESLIELAITRTEKHTNYRYFTRAKGLAELRAGRPAEAIRWFNRFRPTVNDGPFGAGVFAALAMAHQALGNPGDARAALEKAKAIVKEQMPNPAQGRPFDAWHDWLHADILLREAEGLLEGNQAAKSR